MTLWSPGEDPPFEFGLVTIEAVTDDGILLVGDAVEAITGRDEVWIPRHAVHDDGEIRIGAEVGDTGDLMVRMWLARKRGWAPE